MHTVSSIRLLPTAIATAWLALLPVPAAFGADVLGLYAGGAVGQATVAADNVSFSYGDFRENHNAWKGIAGVRLPLGWGLEANYIDFGHPSANVGFVTADVHVKGSAAFAMLYLPVPLVDVYVKAGLARLQADVRVSNPGAGTCPVTSPGCAIVVSRRDRSIFAAGAGAQFNLGPLALRAEYERYDETAGNPTLWSVGLVWKFL